MNIDDSYRTKGNITPKIREELVAYIETGRACGDFLSAALRNDFRAACFHADEKNRFTLYDVAMYLHNYAPSVCWGDRKAVAAWQGHKGLSGWPDAHREPAVET